AAAAAAATATATAVLLGLALVASACSQRGGSAATTTTRSPSTTSERTTTTTEATTTTTVTPTTTSPSDHPVVWADCDGGFQCATISVPIDYSKPAGRQIKIAVARRPAKDQAHKIGSLLMNPGGPGASAIDLIESVPLPTALTDRFDIVGFDPRGVGRSHPLQCRSYLQKIYDDDPSIDDAEDRRIFLTDSKGFVDECAKKYRSLLPFLGTADVARDMDRVRIAVGDARLNYVGFSYGTSIGQEYATLFPRRVRTMVLDGPVNLALDGLAGARAQAGGFSHALDNFIKACDTDDCGLGAPAGQVVDEVIAEAEKQPIPATGVDRPAGPGVVNLALAQGLYSESLWPELARALTQARGGRGAGLVRLADAYLQRNVDGTYPNGFEIYFAVSCLDQAFPRNPQAILDAAKIEGAVYPRFGEGLVNDYVRCAYWPTPAKPLKPVPATTTGLPPIVVISTTGDPATPYAGGVAVAHQIPTGRLITNVGEGHTVFSQGKACIDDAVTAYLVDTKAPADGLVCP
ncbi:MAG: Alpha/beta hydrolase family protein, partial [Acidimicrobiales bacterium]|nr:Alpha/beta hydrolase family protein [Acidimicrobiales bacterium]